MNVPASCAILGLGYLGRPLAETLWQHGSRVFAWKKTVTSDDINLPIDLASGDIADFLANGFQTAFARWQDAQTWVCLLPPSACAHAGENAYADTVRAWAQTAAQYGAQHLIFASSIGVYDGHTGKVDENTALVSRRGRLLAQAEEAVLSAAVPHRDILRLGGLYCAERHPLAAVLARRKTVAAAEPANMLHRSRAVAALFQTACTPNGRRLRNAVEYPQPDKRQFYTAEAAKLGLNPPPFAAGGAGKTVHTLYGDFAAILNVNG
ncbi:hypothetical protein HMPREF9120_02083 [Neisseria sp. oral taxon 020 str. F0370]|uniref:hypothetical protein n=1 Tax=unclassified Neisseria TaxID=2623750 RepID=UPI0002A2F6F8|nr:MULTISPECIES: hypothetical protein [unclassified Neisseria]ASP17603.1 GDP-L-fucose synthase [Neisseria sp. KEM232]EKY04821.1 hypothetical protein HMPREF9120_02083 [Neisseria sp. oral taxon 020 str. F0370]